MFKNICSLSAILVLELHRYREVRRTEFLFGSKIREANFSN